MTQPGGASPHSLAWSVTPGATLWPTAPPKQHIQSREKKADCQSASRGKHEKMQFVLVMDAGGKGRRGRIYLQMLDTSVLTKRVMWRPWRWRSLWYIAVFSVFSRTDSTFGTAEQHRDLLPANYRLMPTVHAGRETHCGSAVDLSAIGRRERRKTKKLNK